MASFARHPGTHIICLVTLLLTLCPPAPGVDFAGGTGDPNNPYQIATAEQLIATGADPNLLDKCFAVVADIDMATWRQAGSVIARITAYVECQGAVGPLFEGTFDGRKYEIRNLTLQGPDGTSCTGLFGQLGKGARVFGVRLVDVSIQVGNFAGDAGGLAGRNEGVVRDCRVSGSLSVGKWTEHIAGLVGSNNGIVINSVASITAQVGADLSVLPDSPIERPGETGAQYVGGLIGINAGVVAQCMASAKITTASRSMSVGGLAGGNSGLICNCSATGGIVAGDGADWLGGLLGSNEDYYGSVVNCFATTSVRASGAVKSVGGLTGSGPRGVSQCYFLAVGGGGGPNNEIGTVLGSSQMRQQASYVGWDFLGQRQDGTSEVWTMPSGGGYPVLGILQGYVPPGLSGSGTGDDPFLIETPEQLGAAAYRLDGCYRLGADIDTSGIAWSSPVIPGLVGSLDGAGHRITHLCVNSLGHAGLMGIIYPGGRVIDLAVEEATITGEGLSHYMGALAGVNGGFIYGCHATGAVSGMEFVGGLVGANDGTVERSWTNCSVSSPAGGLLVGGLVGHGDYMSSIVGCFALGSVSGSASAVGGLVGATGSSRIRSSYARGSVTGLDSVGGLIGEYSGWTLSRCFASGKVAGDTRVGGLIGRKGWEVSVVDCLWDIQAGGVSESAGGLGFNTSEMLSGQTYGLNGWAADPNWILDEGHDYPRLAWEGTPGQPIPEPVVDWPGGNGTPEAPFRIQSAQQLWMIAHASILWNKHFVLDTDLDLGAMLFEPIASNLPGFGGTFDGAGHTLRNLTIRRDSTDTEYIGLFGLGGRICNLTIEDANVVLASSASSIGILVGSGGALTGCRVTGRIQCGDQSHDVGGLVGHSNGGAIRDCHANVVIVAGTRSQNIGGLVGTCWGSVEDCSAAGLVEVVAYGSSLGGLIGSSSGSVSRCCASSSVVGSGWAGVIGGLIGQCDYTTVADCYVTGRVQGTGALGGLIGSTEYRGHGSWIRRCWVAGQVVWQGTVSAGRLKGEGWCYTDSCYRLDPAGAGGTSSGLDTALTTEQMKEKASFVGWDFAGDLTDGTADIWTICEGKDYPRLRWEQVECK